MEPDPLSVEAIAAVERRAFDARATLMEVCASAKINQSVWSRAKGLGRISVTTLRAMEEAISRIESEKAEQRNGI